MSEMKEIISARRLQLEADVSRLATLLLTVGTISLLTVEVR